MLLTHAGLEREGDNWVFEISEPALLHLPCDSIRRDLSGARAELDSLKGEGHAEIAGWALIGGGLGAAVGVVGLLLSNGGANAPGGGGAPPVSMHVSEVAASSVEHTGPPLVKALLFYQTVYNPTPGQTFALAKGFEGPLSANASALTSSGFPQVGMRMGFSGFFKIAGFIPIDEGLGCRLEIALFDQNEEGNALLLTGEQVPVNPEASAILAAVSLASAVTDFATAGLSAKCLKEESEQAEAVRVDSTFLAGHVSATCQVLFTTVRSGGFDVDLSGTVLILPELRVGATVMNVFGLKILQSDGANVSMRAYGAGATYPGGAELLSVPTCRSQKRQILSSAAV